MQLSQYNIVSEQLQQHDKEECTETFASKDVFKNVVEKKTCSSIMNLQPCLNVLCSLP
jgi:hypothetical protein